jgi:hypothetical protein
VRLLLVFGAAALLGGCRFWYKPVPVANAIGEERAVVAGDSVHVYRGERFEVYGPNDEAVYDGYEQLNRAYRTFQRHFGQTPKVAAMLYSDSATSLDVATVRSFFDRGVAIVQYTRPPGARTRSRYGGLDYGGVLWPIAPTVAQTMLARFAAGVAADGATLADTVLLNRLPLWYRAAVIHVVGDAASVRNDLLLVREKRSVLIPFRDMLSMVRSSAADSLLDPTRREQADEFTRTFAAQSAMLAHFLIEREGPLVLARLGRGYLQGRALREMVADFRSAPRTVTELENRWKVWIDLKE